MAATQDLIAMHDLVRDNHPGPIDAQNPGFGHWLNGGEIALLPQARAAHTLHDYQLVLHTYANGFADGHLGVVMKDADAKLWPGFLARADYPDAPLRVSALGTGPDTPAYVTEGAIIDSCGGISARKLIQDRVLLPALNPHVPQRLRLASASLMVADADAPADHFQDCIMTASGDAHSVKLKWRPISQDKLKQEIVQSSGIELPATGLREIGDVWLVSMPSFYPQDAKATTQLQDLIKDVTAKAATLQAARHVVIDLRGNDGGDDGWGIEVAEALWGKAAVDAVEATLPSVIDWRVSARNAIAIRTEAAALKQQGQAAGAVYFFNIAQNMENALKAKQPYWREPSDPPGPIPKVTSPFRHPVYLLTTPHCASACLDFVDLLNGLPGVVRVGLETSSDTDYLEVASADLPSGHATLHYAMKVYRERKRGASVSYKPIIAWRGGEMNDTSIVNWIDQLN
jgi:hypothetical protein